MPLFPVMAIIYDGDYRYKEAQVDNFLIENKHPVESYKNE